MTDKIKAPGWLKDSKFLYSDNKVQELVKKIKEVPGVAGGPDGTKSQSKRPQHQTKVHFKPSEAVAKEAFKVHEILSKMVNKTKDGGNNSKEDEKRGDKKKELKKEEAKKEDQKKEDKSS